MGKLNQVIAVEKGTKARTHQAVADAYQTLGKTQLMTGLARQYRPHDEEGQQFPPESQRVQVTATDLIARMQKALVDLFDVTATKDWANCKATADVVVDGTVVLRHVPATYLLFLEKQLVDIHTFVLHLPALDPADEWTLDSNTGVYKTGTSQTLRSQKVLRNHVLSEATKEHPAQVQVYSEDIPVGTWSSTKFSGALPQTRIQELSDRVERLQRAVKTAREEANMTEAPLVKTGEAVFAYLFA